MLEKEKATVLTVRVILRPAKAKDFVVGEKQKKIGLSYFLQNGSGRIEAYEFTERMDTKELAEFIKQKKCFVIATVKDADYDAKLEVMEFAWLNKEVKQK
jgi:hypothetical protein